MWEAVCPKRVQPAPIRILPSANAAPNVGRTTSDALPTGLCFESAIWLGVHIGVPTVSVTAGQSAAMENPVTQAQDGLGFAVDYQDFGYSLPQHSLDYFLKITGGWLRASAACKIAVEIATLAIVNDMDLANRPALVCIHCQHYAACIGSSVFVEPSEKPAAYELSTLPWTIRINRTAMFRPIRQMPARFTGTFVQGVDCEIYAAGITGAAFPFI
jgi:hypothetical protein